MRSLADTLKCGCSVTSGAEPAPSRSINRTKYSWLEQVFSSPMRIQRTILFMNGPISDALKVSNLISRLLDRGQEGRAERVQTLVQLLSVRIGQPQSAQVQNVAPVTSEQRQSLLNATLEALAQLEKVPPSAQRERQVGQLQAQQQLLNAPLLKLVKLLLNGRPLVTYTDRTLEQGQTVQVRLTDSNRLALLPLPQDEAAPKTKLSKPTQMMLGQALRSALSLQDRPTLLEVMPRIQALPLPHRQALLSPSLQQALHAVAQQLRSPAQLSQPQVLRAALQANGVFFERALAHSLVSGKQSPGPATASSDLTSSDLKGALLHTLQRVTAELRQLGHPQPRPVDPTPAPAPPTTAPASGTLPGAEATPPLRDLSQLIAQLAHRPLAELSNRTLRTQLLVLLHRQTLNSLARIQFQQLQTLSQQTARTEAPQTPQSWTLEIPVRYGLEQHNLSLHIEQDWIPPKEEQNQPAALTKKTKRWQVLLSFSLPEAGNVYAQLTLVGDSVAAKLWTEQRDTLREVNAKLGVLRQQLQDQGIEVTQLDCVQGTPPNKTQKLHYSLVDIRT